jgi:hypothetical protein
MPTTGGTSFVFGYGRWISNLKAVINQSGFDPGKVAVRWTDHDKFVALVVEQTQARLTRGAAFLATNAGPLEP